MKLRKSVPLRCELWGQDTLNKYEHNPEMAKVTFSVAILKVCVSPVVLDDVKLVYVKLHPGSALTQDCDVTAGPHSP